MSWENPTTTIQRLTIVFVTVWVLRAAILTGPKTAGESANAGSKRLVPPRLGFTDFPYAKTTAAVRFTRETVATHSTLSVVQLDNGICWEEALRESPWPQAVQQDWNNRSLVLSHDRPCFVSVAPLAANRRDLAPSFPGTRFPGEMKNAALDSSQVRRAYLNYLRRVVEVFQPAFLNIGQEAGLLAHRDPAKWAELVQTVVFLYAELKQEEPTLQIGISFELHSLMDREVARRARDIWQSIDFLGISFYPHLSPFGEKHGLAPLSSGPDSWRRPLEWLQTYSDKPIAICETGISSRPAGALRAEFATDCSPAMQRQYLQFLADIAERDRYLFVVWFCVADFDQLLQDLPGESDIARLWVDTGLFDSQLRPKPAWEAWGKALRRFQ